MSLCINPSRVCPPLLYTCCLLWWRNKFALHKGTWKLLVHWESLPDTDATWEPLDQFHVVYRTFLLEDKLFLQDRGDVVDVRKRTDWSLAEFKDLISAANISFYLFLDLLKSFPYNRILFWYLLIVLAYIRWTKLWNKISRIVDLDWGLSSLSPPNEFQVRAPFKLTSVTIGRGRNRGKAKATAFKFDFMVNRLVMGSQTQGHNRRSLGARRNLCMSSRS